jgi:sugar phosphate isomerase/epimerase
MRLAVSNLAWNPADNEAVYTLMERYGFTGLEIAPTKIIPVEPYSHIVEAAAWMSDLKVRHALCIPSMQSICYGRNERLFGPDAERESLLGYVKTAVDFAVAIGCGNLVFGCPKNRMIPDGADEDVAVAFFRELGRYAAEKGTCIGMEANPAIYGTNFINTTGQALDLIKSVASEGFLLNLDVGTMIQNGECIDVLNGCGPLINHVHISEPYLKKIRANNLHDQLLSFLASEGYNGFVSVEMGFQENLSDIEDVMKYVNDVYGIEV